MRLALVGMGMLIGAWQTSACAQGAPEPPAPAPTAVAAPADRVPLSLSEAISLGIENNTNVQIVRYDPPIASYQHDAAWGYYDPSLFANYDYTSQNLAVASAFSPTEGGSGVGEFIERDSGGSAGVAGVIPRLGWGYRLAYDALDTQSNSIVQTLGTTYSSSLTLSMTAPLLRGAWWGYGWTQVEVSGIDSALALEQFRANLTGIISAVETSYWNLAAAKQELEVANKSLDTRRALLAQTKAEYEVGVKSRVEVIEAEAGVADREFNQITVANLYLTAQDTLIDQVYGPKLTPTMRLEVEPTDRPEDYTTFTLDPDASTAKALERRPELIIARQLVERNEILLKFAKNERLPQLDLRGSYGTHGLSGNNPNCPFSQIDSATGNCLIVPTQPSGVGTDFSDNTDFWFKGDKDRVWSAGAVVSMPIPNTTARANVNSSELALRKANTQVKRTEQDIVLDVRDAVRNLASALEGIEAAERGVAASTEQLRAEKIRLEHGESTPFEVNQREEALVQAESQRIRALYVYHVSVTALDRAQGTLIEDRSIVLEDALTLR
jgi:outer membrane protein TolC